MYLYNSMFLMFILIIMVLMSVAFLTLMERKILSFIHYRKGPNKVGYWGLLQPFSDALKLMSKEFFYPNKSNYYLFMISPMIMFIIITTFWLIYPFMTNLLNLNLNSLFFLCLMSMSVYGMMISGWSSNSSFSMMGSIRSIAQSISYEVTFAISFILTLFMINNLNLTFLSIHQKYIWLFILMWPSSIILLMSMLAEINRTPFDLSEGESELVSGFNLEYSSHGFVLIFLSEYSSIMFMMFLFNMMYFNMYMMNMMFYLTFLIMLMFTIWIRSTLPRIRYDKLMFFCWIYLLPLILLIYIFYLMMKYSNTHFLYN